MKYKIITESKTYGDDVFCETKDARWAENQLSWAFYWFKDTIVPEEGDVNEIIITFSTKKVTK